MLDGAFEKKMSNKPAMSSHDPATLHVDKDCKIRQCRFRPNQEAQAQKQQELKQAQAQAEWFNEQEGMSMDPYGRPSQIITIYAHQIGCT